VEHTPETNLRLAQFLERSARVEKAEQSCARWTPTAAAPALPDFDLARPAAPQPQATSFGRASLSGADKARQASHPAALFANQRGAAIVARLIEARSCRIDLAGYYRAIKPWRGSEPALPILSGQSRIAPQSCFPAFRWHGFAFVSAAAHGSRAISSHYRQDSTPASVGVRRQLLWPPRLGHG